MRRVRNDHPRFCWTSAPPLSRIRIQTVEDASHVACAQEALDKPYGLGYTGSPVVSGKPNMRFKL